MENSRDDEEVELMVVGAAVEQFDSPPAVDDRIADLTK